MFFIKEIIVLKDEVIFVKKILKEVKVNKSEIKSINVKFGGMLEIKLNEKTLYGFSDFDGFSSFVENVRKVNPELVTKGC